MDQVHIFALNQRGQAQNVLVYHHRVLGMQGQLNVFAAGAGNFVHLGTTYGYHQGAATCVRYSLGDLHSATFHATTRP